MPVRLFVVLTALAIAALCVKTAFVYRAHRAVFLPVTGTVAWPVGAEFAQLRSIAFGSPVIRGWLLPPRNGITVILLHGAGATRTQMLPEARLLANAGYGLLMFDWPGSGESGGRCEWGHAERNALRQAIDFVTSRTSAHDQLAALGFSMGGAILTQVAATDTRVRAVVLNGTYARSTEQMYTAFGRWAPLLQWPARWDWWWPGMKASDPQPADVVAAISPRPVLIVTGTADGTVAPWMSRRLFESARDPKEFWMVEGGSHGNYSDVAPVEYPARLLRFLSTAFAEAPISPAAGRLRN